MSKCTCGADKTGDLAHSDWCDKGKPTPEMTCPLIDPRDEDDFAKWYNRDLGIGKDEDDDGYVRWGHI